MSPGPFSLPNPFTDPFRRRLASLALPALERSLSLSTLNAIYAELSERDDGRHFSDKALEALGVRYEVSEEDLSRIPAAGPLVVVANHPFGGLDGLVLISMLRRVRSDLRLMGNHLLAALPDLRGTLLAVDPFGGSGAHVRNLPGLRAALAWVRGGGTLGVFPAGAVAHARLGSLKVSEPPWGEAVGRLILAASAPVLTVFFEGRNSVGFQLAGLVHPRLRTAMLPRELLAHRGRTIRARVGGVIPPERLAGVGSPSEAAGYLRVRTFVLGESLSPRWDRNTSVGAAPEPVAEAGPPEEVEREVANLPEKQVLLRSGDYRVAFARAGQVPALLAEIGRQREIAFRFVGEGTGRAVDIDRFDRHYVHLFLWNERRAELVGGYRMGPTDEILPRHGVDGLYTSTLFRFRRPLMDQIGPALEMGRSFVRREYQRATPALTLLWKGIGRYVAQRPRYRRLFGPVSISNEYRSMSRQLLMAFLSMNRYVDDLGRLIRPRHPARFGPGALDHRTAGTVVRDLDEVDTLIREIESDRRSIPVLLRQYLRLNGVLLGFNVDREFGGVLDGLILVDLVRVDRPLLVRYMGVEGAAGFLAHHDVQSASAGVGRER